MKWLWLIELVDELLSAIILTLVYVCIYRYLGIAYAIIIAYVALYIAIVKRK